MLSGEDEEHVDKVEGLQGLSTIAVGPALGFWSAKKNNKKHVKEICSLFIYFCNLYVLKIHLGLILIK